MTRQPRKRTNRVAALRTHSPTACEGTACVVHNPSDHHMKAWPINYRFDRAARMPDRNLSGAVIAGPVFILAERICPHGVGHPDPDSLDFARREGGEDFAGAEGVHGCDGCCRPNAAHQYTPEEWPQAVEGLPDSHPVVAALREKFFAALDAQDSEVIVLGADDDEDEEALVRKFDEALASGEQVTVTAPPLGWTGPVYTICGHCKQRAEGSAFAQGLADVEVGTEWYAVSAGLALTPWDEPLWVALTPREKMDGTYYPVTVAVYHGDGDWHEVNGLSLDDEVTHWADMKYPRHPGRPVR